MKKIYFIILLFTIVYSQDYDWKKDKEFKSISVISRFIDDIAEHRKEISIIDSLLSTMMHNKKKFTNGEWAVYMIYEGKRSDILIAIYKIENKISEFYKEYINEIVREATRK